MKRLIKVFLLVWLGSAGAFAQLSAVNTILKFPQIDGVSISPDGKLVAYTTLARDPSYDVAQRSLWVISAAPGSAAKKLADRLEPQSALIQWSSDSKQVAYLLGSGAYDDLVVQSISTGRSRTILHQLAIQNFQWSPTKPEVAVVFSEPLRKREHVDLEEVGKGQAEAGPDLYLVSVLDDRRTRLTTDNTVEDIAWSPSANVISFSSGSDLFVVPVSGGPARRVIARPGKDVLPTWSHDGTRLAFASQGGNPKGLLSLSILNLKTGAISDAVAGVDFGFGGYPPRYISWNSDDSGVYVPVLSNMTQHLFEVNISGAARPVSSGQSVFQNFSFSADAQRAAFLATSSTTPIRLCMSEVGKFDPKTLTAQEAPSTQVMGSLEKFGWKSVDGTQIAGLLLSPPGFQKNRKYPLVVVMEGTYGTFDLSFSGRDSADTPSALFPFQPRLLAAAGCLVLLPNPRGSWGFGEDFRKLGEHDFAEGPYSDIVSGVDALIREGSVDRARIAILGIAFDAFRTAYAITRSDRFKSAIVIQPLGANLTSTYGEGNAWIRSVLERRMGGPPWSHVQEYVAASPALSDHKVSTATLIVSLKDPEWVAGQAAELESKLKSSGAKVRHLKYNQNQNEFGITKLKAFGDLMSQCMDWLGQTLLKSEDASRP